MVSMKCGFRDGVLMLLELSIVLKFLILLFCVRKGERQKEITLTSGSRGSHKYVEKMLLLGHCI